MKSFEFLGFEKVEDKKREERENEERNETRYPRSLDLLYCTERRVLLFLLNYQI